MHQTMKCSSDNSLFMKCTSQHFTCCYKYTTNINKLWNNPIPIAVKLLQKCECLFSHQQPWILFRLPHLLNFIKFTAIYAEKFKTDLFANVLKTENWCQFLSRWYSMLSTTCFLWLSMRHFWILTWIYLCRKSPTIHSDCQTKNKALNSEDLHHHGIIIMDEVWHQQDSSRSGRPSKLNLLASKSGLER